MEIKNLNNFDGFIAKTGIKCLEAGKGSARGEFEITPEHLNPIKTVHGGMIFTLADTIGGIAASSWGQYCTTVSSEIHYLSPTMNCKKLIAVSEELKHGKRMSTVETLIVDENNNKISKVISVFYYLNKDGKAV